jgi:hypothetical protein
MPASSPRLASPDITLTRLHNFHAVGAVNPKRGETAVQMSTGENKWNKWFVSGVPARTFVTIAHGDVFAHVC